MMRAETENEGIQVIRRYTFAATGVKKTKKAPILDVVLLLLTSLQGRRNLILTTGLKRRSITALSDKPTNLTHLASRLYYGEPVLAWEAPKPIFGSF
jgi:hypothetical protein